MMEEIHRKYHEASALFPLLEGNEFEQLKADIAANGLLEPIWLHPDGSVLDGRNRHRACIETKIEPRFRIWSGDGSCMAFVISMNLHRRHLSETQRSIVANKIANMPTHRPSGKSANLPTSVSQPEAARMLNVSSRSIRSIAKIQREAPDLMLAMESGELTAHRATRIIKERQRDEEWARIQNTLQPTDEKNWPKSIELLTGDFTQIGPQLPAESFDLIITDPPYGEDNVYLYGVLAEQAARLLVPGGSLLAMAGQLCIPQTLNVMTPHLNYHWIISYDTPGGQSPQIWSRKVNSFWKPVLWFVKGEYKGGWHGDKVKSNVNDNDKRFHKWGQSESGIGKLVSEFASTGTSKVLDPFVGGGTVAVVSYRLRISFVGIDSSADAITTTRQRMLMEMENERS